MADRAEVIFTFRDTSPTSGSGSGGGTSVTPPPVAQGTKSAVEAVKETSKSVTEDVSKTVSAGSSIKQAAMSFGSSAMQAGQSVMSTVASLANPVTATIAVIGGLGYAAKKASDALRSIGQEVGGLSPQVVAGRARIDQQKFEQDRQRAKRFGSRIARQEEVDAKMDRALTELSDDLTDFFSPLGELYTEAKSFFADAIGWLSGVEKNTRKTDNPFTAIDGLFQKFAKLDNVADQLRWLEKRKGKMGASGKELAPAGIAINGLPAGAN